MQKIRLLGIGGLALFGLLLGWLFFLMEPLIASQPYNETSLVNTTVNITNAAPLVQFITAPTPINLIAYDTIIVECNATVYDFDNNTQGANATFHLSTVSSLSSPDGNYLYHNTSCTRVSPLDYYTNFTCAFTVNYYANNGTWYCNVTAIDSLNSTGNNISNPATVNPLIAIKMDPLLDFGNVGVNDISGDTLANITNAGNRNANISVKGYGVVEGDGLAMDCDSGSISVENIRYDIYEGSSFGFMFPLSPYDTMISSFFVPQRTNEFLDSVNSTYWKIMIPPGAGGVCRGKILFTASDKGE